MAYPNENEAVRDRRTVVSQQMFSWILLSTENVLERYISNVVLAEHTEKVVHVFSFPSN